MISRVTGVASLALSLWALYWTLRVERADWLFVRGDAASIRQAMLLAPGHAEYSSALADVDPDRALPILREAVVRNPLDGGLQVQLGLAEERQGDFAGAEASLRRATRLDRGFGPRWALSDFYFDRRDEAHFWPAVKETLATSYGDVSAQFRQCWALTSCAATVERALPARPKVWKLYLDFLLSTGRLDAAVPVADRVLAGVNREGAPSLLNYCDRMLAQWRGQEALRVWNGLAVRERVAAPGRGFDWRAAQLDGIDIESTTDGWTIGFSGREPESAEILSRYVVLLPGRRNVLRLQYRTSGIPADSGLRFDLYLADGRDLFGGAAMQPGAVAFQTPANATLGRLVLGYRRVPGTIRIEGTLALQKFAVEAAEGR
jgi:hypothetical protein